MAAPHVTIVPGSLLSLFHITVHQWFSILATIGTIWGALKVPTPRTGSDSIWDELSLWGDGNALKLGCGDGCTTL